MSTANGRTNYIQDFLEWDRERESARVPQYVDRLLSFPVPHFDLWKIYGHEEGSTAGYTNVLVLTCCGTLPDAQRAIGDLSGGRYDFTSIDSITRIVRGPDALLLDGSTNDGVANQTGFEMHPKVAEAIAAMIIQSAIADTRRRDYIDGLSRRAEANGEGAKS